MRFLVPLLLLLVLVALLLVFWPSGDESETERLAATIRRVYPRSIRRADVEHFDQDVTDTLFAWLDEPTWEPWSGNIVRAIGLIGRGTDADADRLFGLVGQGTGTLGYATYAGKQAVMPALGNLVFYSGSARALELLRTHTQPPSWEDDGFPRWESPYGESRAFIRTHFRKLTLIGLGMSGTHEAEVVLTSLQPGIDPHTSVEETRFRNASKEILREGLERNAARRALLGR